MKNIIIIILGIGVLLLAFTVSSLYQTADQVVKDKEAFRHLAKGCEAQLQLVSFYGEKEK